MQRGTPAANGSRGRRRLVLVTVASTNVRLMALSGKRQLQGVAGLEHVFIQEALTAAQRAQRPPWANRPRFMLLQASSTAVICNSTHSHQAP